MIVYLDTSVLVAYYTVEDRTSDAAAIIERAELPVRLTTDIWERPAGSQSRSKHPCAPWTRCTSQ